MIEAVPDRLDGSPRQLRRFWSDEFKAAAVEQVCQPGVNMQAVARQIGILPSQLYRRRRELLGGDEPGQAAAAVDPQSVAPAPECTETYFFHLQKPNHLFRNYRLFPYAENRSCRLSVMVFSLFLA